MWTIPLGLGNPRGERGGGGVSHLVTPMCRDRFSQWLPAEKDTREQVRQVGNLSYHQEALAAPDSQNACSLEHPWLVSGMLKNTVFTDRETEAQPGKPSGSKALQFCLAGPKWLGGWARHSDPSAEAGCSSGAGVGKPGPRATRTSTPSRPLTSLQFLNCRMKWEDRCGTLPAQLSVQTGALTSREPEG